jgi:hypothetical protein
MRRWLTAAVFAICAVLPAAGQAQYVGIPSATFNYVYSAQANSQWCWAASIQMILNYYGVDIAQEEIVRRSFGSDPYGNLPNWPGSFQVITANLNNWGIDANGQRYRVQAVFGNGPPVPSMLLQELSNGQPVLIAYMTGPSSGHAVVATAASYTPSPAGPVVQSIVVRDPWPSPENMGTNGRREYPGAALASQMRHYWIIRVQRL